MSVPRDVTNQVIDASKNVRALTRWTVQQQPIGCPTQAGKEIRPFHGPTNNLLDRLLLIIETGNVIKSDAIPTFHDFVFNLGHEILAISLKFFG